MLVSASSRLVAPNTTSSVEMSPRSYSARTWLAETLLRDRCAAAGDRELTREGDAASTQGGRLGAERLQPRLRSRQLLVECVEAERGRAGLRGQGSRLRAERGC